MGSPVVDQTKKDKQTQDQKPADNSKIDFSKRFSSGFDKLAADGAKFTPDSKQAKDGKPAAITLPKLPGTKADSDKEQKNIPAPVIAKALQFGLKIEDIKLQEGMWVGCTDSSCIPLGKASSFKTDDKNAKPDDKQAEKKQATEEEKKAALAKQLQSLPVGSTIKVIDPAPGTRSEFVLSKQEAQLGGSGFGIGGFGSFKKNSDGTYSFSKAPELKNEIEVVVPGTAKNIETNIKNVASMKEAREYISSHPKEGIMVLGTVPSLCPPCRTLEGILPNMINDLKAEGAPVTVLRMEYDSFESAKKEFGSGATFPYMALFGKAARDQSDPDIEVTRGPIIQGLGGLRKVVRGISNDLKDSLRNIGK